MMKFFVFLNQNNDEIITNKKSVKHDQLKNRIIQIK